MILMLFDKITEHWKVADGPESIEKVWKFKELYKYTNFIVPYLNHNF